MRRLTRYGSTWLAHAVAALELTLVADCAQHRAAPYTTTATRTACSYFSHTNAKRLWNTTASTYQPYNFLCRDGVHETGCFVPLDSTGKPQLGGQGARPAMDEITKEQRTNQQSRCLLMRKVSHYKQSNPAKKKSDWLSTLAWTRIMCQ